MRTHVPVLWESHEVVPASQNDKLKRMDRLMYDCWRQGLKRSNILALAQAIESATTEEDVALFCCDVFPGAIRRCAVFEPLVIGWVKAL
ncbi:hypothetical protein ACP3V3_16905 [Vibrio sp. PNB22_3_1]